MLMKSKNINRIHFQIFSTLRYGGELPASDSSQWLGKHDLGGVYLSGLPKILAGGPSTTRLIKNLLFLLLQIGKQIGSTNLQPTQPIQAF